ncbi:hypothetical protein H5P28_00255 [Ruficoccus amylovorans]|uniref:Uncharacterized protein n=1 Tax=Ruficoccus amylovorans TaxID=1804625 RepID=A0A842H826_9BACT|nr:hypothetical protein [Ruficoccus amylovorans]MBC2592683.1 hypothetical protein [Ruficoccus amylovorans]
MKLKKLILILGLAIGGLCLTGCDPDDNAVGRFLYTTSGGVYQVSDQYGNSLRFTDEQAQTLIGMDESTRVTALEEVFRTQFPASYGEGSAAPVITPTEVEAGEVAVSETAQTAVAALNFIPVWGQLASLVAAGALGISTLWMGKRYSTAQATAKSLVIGVDTFRNVLDQTEQGAVIDEALTKALRKAKEAEGGAVVDAVSGLLKRYTTADVPSGLTVTPAAATSSASTAK